MSGKQVTINQRSLDKVVAHLLKNQKSDCIGILLGHRQSANEVSVTDAVPLFHDRVFASTLESAFAMV